MSDAAHSQPSRTAVWILGDQLLPSHPALERALELGEKRRTTVVMVESEAARHRQPYHRQRIALLLSAMRHYAEHLESEGWHVDYRRAPTLLAGLESACRSVGADRLVTVAASRWAGRRRQAESLENELGLPVELIASRQFLFERENPFPDAPPDTRIVMETFYRALRKRYAVLMDGDRPAGGAWNFDRENRKPLPRGVAPPPVPAFEPDEVTASVLDQLESENDAPYVGRLRPFRWPVTRQQALAALADFVERRLPLFGPYQDALSAEHATLFHSLLSPALNLGLLEPLEVVAAAERAYRDGHAPIQSVEGFVRQVLGWREFMAWQYWRSMPGLEEANHWGHRGPIPSFYWDADTTMECVRSAVRRALDSGYAHHIERLMILGNLSLLLGLEPKAVNRWFLAMFVDAFDWVMPPNVIGMALHADGGVVGTKPYIASASYLRRMGDHCAGCRYDPKQRTGDDACPFNALYWDFVLEHEAELRLNPRSSKLALGLRHLDEDERERVRERARRLRQAARASD